MSLNSIIGTANSGLQTAQAQLKVVSDNVANVNTPGYVRKTVDTTALVTAGQGSGVGIAQIRNVIDQFLQTASLGATSDASKASAQSSTLAQAQALFGDPSTTGSYFSTLDNVFTAFSTLAANPTTAGRSQALAQVSTFFNQSASVSGSLTQLSTQTDQKISADVTQVNSLLSQIDALNTTISRASVSGGDATGSQNQQTQLVSQLSTLMDVKTSATASGGVVVRASDGTVLAGQNGPSTLSYDPSGPTGQITLTNAQGATSALGSRLTSGELAGLMSLRNTDLPGMQSQLSELTSGVADALNSASNAYSSAPPPTALTGTNTGLDLPSAVSGFTGKTTIAEVKSDGTLDHRIDIDFDAKTISVDGGAAASFTASSFLSTLNTALSPAAGATFTNGALSLTSTGTDGLAVQDSATTPASNGGKGFSDYFGLNDLVSSSTQTNYNTGLTAASASGFPPGQGITLRIADANGVRMQDITVQTPAGGTMQNMLDALNAPSGGVGLYGSFALDANGAMTFTPKAGSGVTLAVAKDTTANTATGTSLSQLFGIGDAQRNTRAASYSVRPDLMQNPSSLGLSSLNLSATAGTAVLAAGDTSGADALGQASISNRTFAAAGGMASAVSTISDYASTIAAAIARKASAADTASTQASAVSTEATSRLTSSDGVSLDEELVNLTTYQQSYNASARLVQAGKDLYDTLLSMVGN